MRHALSTTLHAPQKDKILPKSTKALKKRLQILQFVLEKTSPREDICLQTMTSHFICQPPDKRILVGTLQEQIAMGDVIDIIGAFPSPEYRRVYFSRGNIFRSRLFLRQILKLQFLLTRCVNNLSRGRKHVSFFCRKTDRRVFVLNAVGSYLFLLP